MKIKDLRLALTATPKKSDIRFYLNAVCITPENVTGSDGHLLCNIKTYHNQIPIEHDKILVPVETIKALLKKMEAKHEGYEVEIALINERYELSCLNQVEIFTPIDHNYPDFSKHTNAVIDNDHDKSLNAIQHQFDWDYVSKANTAICKYFGNNTPKRLYSTHALGYFMPSEDIIYIVMPTRI